MADQRVTQTTWGEDRRVRGLIPGKRSGRGPTELWRAGGGDVQGRSPSPSDVLRGWIDDRTEFQTICQKGRGPRQKNARIFRKLDFHRPATLFFLIRYYAAAGLLQCCGVGRQPCAIAVVHARPLLGFR